MTKTKPICEIRLDIAGALAVLKEAGLVKSIHGQPPAGSAHLRTDSREVRPGDLFLAYKGVSGDAHDFLSQAAAKGAGLLIVEDLEKVPAGQASVLVTSGRAAWTWLAAFAHGHPERELSFFGVTGTNGKTSTVWILKELLEKQSQSAAMPVCAIGTLGAYLDQDFLPTGHTTPDPPAFFQILRKAVDRGIKICAMEVSSHAVVQEKLGPVRFDGVAFTSFSRDHLDFHGSMDAYWEAKWKLITSYTTEGATLAFADSLSRPPALRELGKAPETWVYGQKARETAESWGARHFLAYRVEAMDIHQTVVGLASDIGAASGSLDPLPFIGGHSLENFAAAMILAGRALGRPEVRIPTRFRQDLRPVPGRLECVGKPGGPQVVVDYAHTPDALEKVLAVLRPLTPGRLITVFGCGGDRDPGKRPLMGRIAERLSDALVITSDNPRTEDPQAILDQIVQGLESRDLARPVVDREKAIRLAVSLAGPGDTVVIAGKGHETYQIIGSETRPFDDREVARLALAARMGKKISEEKISKEKTSKEYP